MNFKMKDINSQEIPDINGLTELNLKCIGPIVGGKKWNRRLLEKK